MTGVKRLIFSVIVFSHLVWSCQEPDPQTLTIAAAANVQFALDSLVQQFEQSTGVSCEMIISSSGKLTAQISKGAPYDVFLSADMKYPLSLYEQGYVKAAPTVYAHGSLVLWTFDDSSDTDLWRKLISEDTEAIAVANPKIAPYGEAALQTLELLDLLSIVDSKLIYGESIAQTNHFISSGAADIGFTAKSVVLSPQMNGKGRWVGVDLTSHATIEQGMAIIEHDGNEIPAAQKFFDFMLSTQAEAILLHFGYQIPR